MLFAAGVVGVCGWLAAGYRFIKTLGGKPGSIAVPTGRDWRKVSSSWGLYVAVRRCPTASQASLRRTSLWGTQWGQLDGPAGRPPLGAGSRGRALRRPYLTTNPASRPTVTLAPSAPGAGVKIVTWLILPVVICLSQRLSHACLSISNLYCETANGSLNQLSFI